MIDQFIAWSNHWGNVASIVALVITVVGFVATLIGVYRAKSAAEEAKDAAVATRDTLLYTDTIAELSAAIATMDEIKRLHRAGAWAILPDRYSSLRQKLIRIESSNTSLDDEYRADLRIAVGHLSRFEAKVDSALSTGSIPPNPAKLNQIVSAQMDTIDRVLRTLQRTQVTANV